MRVYKFTASWCANCVVLDKELARIKGGLDIEVIDAGSPQGEFLITKFGVRGLPSLVKTRDVKGEEEVYQSLIGVKHSRETLEKFLEAK